MNSKKRLIVFIAIFLIIDVALFSWIMSIVNEKKTERLAEEEKARREAEKKKAEEMLEMEIASHVYSHRGASGEETEHTIKAYDLAISYGSKNIEQDIVVSAEGDLYVSHDLTATRLTGRNAYYSDMTDAEIDNLRTYDGQIILKLSDVFDRYGETVSYIIELKDGSEETISAFTEIVDKYGYANRIVLQCFYPEVLEQMESVYPDMPKLYLCKTQDQFNYGLDLPYADILAVKKFLMNQENCDAAHSNGKQFNVWTIDTESDIRTAIDLGVDSYFTNDTELALSLEKMNIKKRKNFYRKQ